MSQVTIQIKNLDKLQAIANKFPELARLHVDDAIVRSIGEIARETQPLTPVDTARLKNSFQPKFSPFEGRYGTNVVYASSVNSLYSPGTPYKNPSKNKSAVAGFLEIGSQRAQNAIQQAFDTALQKIVSSLAW